MPTVDVNAAVADTGDGPLHAMVANEGRFANLMDKVIARRTGTIYNREIFKFYDFFM